MEKTGPIETSEADDCIATVRKTISDATALELSGNWEKALQLLESVREKAENILNEAPSTSHPQKWAVNDPRSVKKELLNHIRLCNEKLIAFADLMAPPSYEEAMSTNTSVSSDGLDGISTFGSTNSSSTDSNNSTNLSYSQLGSMLENLKVESNSQAVEMIYSCDNVCLYFISNSERVTTSSGPDVARVFEVTDGFPDGLPKYYLQIHTFVYPLVRQVSPCIRTEFGAILLPNITPDQFTGPDNQSIGLVVPKEHEEEFILILENILGTKIVFCDTSKQSEPGSKISSTIISGAESVSNFLVQGAQKAEQFMDGNTPKIIEKIDHRPRRVAPCVKNGIKIARDVTSVTANVTGFVASKVGAATYSLGQFLAPHIRNKGGKILSQTTGMDQTRANRKIDSVLNVTAGAVEGVGTIYNGLESSARIFGRSLSNNTVEIVKHRYGRPAAEFTQDTFETVSNGIEIGTNIRMFKPKNLTKTAMKGAVGVRCAAAAAASDSNSQYTDSASGSTRVGSSFSNLSDVSDAKSSLVDVDASGSTRVGSSFSNLSDVSDAKSSLVDVDNDKLTKQQEAERPVAFSSEVLRPTVVSPCCQKGEAVPQPSSTGASGTTSDGKSPSVGVQDLLS